MRVTRENFKCYDNSISSAVSEPSYSRWRLGVGNGGHRNNGASRVGVRKLDVGEPGDQREGQLAHAATESLRTD